MDSLNDKFFNFEGNNWFKRYRKIMQNENIMVMATQPK